MTPAEHLAEAERLMIEAYNPPSPGIPYLDLNRVGAAIGHALIAAAAELGVPHADTTTGGGASAPQAPAG